MLKKFISVFLCTLIFTVNVIFTPYITTVYASGIVTDIAKSISFDNVVKMVKSLYKVGYNVVTTGSGDGAASSKALDSIWGEDSAVNKWLQTKLFPFMDSSGNIDLTKDDCPISYDNEKQLVEFNPTFTTELNQQLQDSIHDMDGYWLIIPSNIWDINKIASWNKSNGYNYSRASLNYFKEFMGDCLAYWKNGPYSNKFLRFDISDLLYYDDNYVYNYNDGIKIRDISCVIFSSQSCYAGTSTAYFSAGKYDATIKYMLEFFVEYSYGAPFKIFKSYDYLQRYLNNGKQRTYIPQLPSGGFKVNIKYINNTTNLPDINVNLDSLVGKVEADVQTDLDLTLKNYLDHLADFTDGGGTTNPTPTPSGGGSGGDFGDGTTPTPKPDFTDGSLTDTNTLLQKILDKLTEFSANHDKLAKTITDYIEKNDGKLEEILIAIQALSDGKTETEQNGCKYDFTALSEYLTTLWNNSDKKFDEMVKLLEENNKYQQKLVDSLNEIKALLIADTVMDFFKDRSQETAEKAKDKFPTSIPWDISLVLNSMSAEPKNPKFSLPIKIESFKINETIDIDLSTDEWEKLAKTCRYILSVTFILFLIHLSRKLFSNGGDD